MNEEKLRISAYRNKPVIKN